MNFDKLKSQSEQTPEIDIPELDNTIVAAGRLKEIKGFEELIEAFAYAQLDGTRLLILGEGPLRPMLESKVQELNAADVVSLPGSVRNPMPYFKLAKGCILSSRIEGFPNVLLEMMVLMLTSWLLASLVSMLVPVWMGRQIFKFCLSDNSRIYELYTFALGIYVCLLAIRFCTVVTGWIQQGLEQLSRRALEWAHLVRTRMLHSDTRFLL